MKRREFIALVSGVAAAPMAWVRDGSAQQRNSPRIAILNGFADDATDLRMQPFLQELQALGWAEGRNIIIDYRQVTEIGKLGAAAREIVETKPNVIMVMPTPAMQAVWRATRSIPVVFANVSDPVEGGFVTSLARPDGNATGFTSFEYSLGGKWLEILKEYAPDTKRALVLVVQENYTSRGLLRAIESAGPSLGIQVIAAPVKSRADIEQAIKTFVTEGGGGLLTPPHPIITNNMKLVFELAAAHRLPAVYPFRPFAVNGGLVAYGSMESDIYRRAAGYVDRILKGAKPGELPVQNPVKFELVVNLKTAKAMGLTIPSSFLIRADEVIE
jgi:putative ABC transport system substrate-binding protein